MSVIIDISDSITQAMNGHTFSKPFKAERVYVQIADLSNISSLQVIVAPRSVDMTTGTRGSLQRDVQIDVAVQDKMPANKAEQKAFCDDLMGLTQEIADFLRSTRDFADGLWVRSANSPIYVPEHMEQFRLFTSVLTLTLRDMRA
jgi:hypothetical protein